MSQLGMIKDGEHLAEELILQAARRVFTRKGFNGARMQEIADEAGMNKALLHYYFRSKDKLFDKVFLDAFKEFWPPIEAAMGKKVVSATQLIWAIIDSYMIILKKSPFLPNFLISELNRSPEKVADLVLASGVQPAAMIDVLNRSIEKGEIKEMDPRELLLNIVGLCVFPFLIRPLAQKVMWSSSDLYDQFLEDRRQTVFDFVCKSVLNEK